MGGGLRSTTDFQGDRSIFSGPALSYRAAERPVHNQGKRRSVTARGKRLDVQGLRAVAVIAVVVNHLTSHPIGGFVGVGVFFVISGYLITGRLTRMLGTRSAGTYLWDFYKLRIRRILPAALVVIALTVLVGEAILAGPRAH